MTKADLINAIAEKGEYSKKEATKALEAVIDSITDAIAAKEKVQLVGFGSFDVRARKATTAKNPKTGETVDVPAKNVPVFKPGKALKDIVNK